MYFEPVHAPYEVKEVAKMGEQKKASIIQILELIEYGNVSQNEAVRRLEALLQSEIDQKDSAISRYSVSRTSDKLYTKV